MASAKLTLMGLHNYDSTTLWENLTLPTGIDEDTAKETILQECGEFPLIYPDLDAMSALIGTWSNKWERTFTKWVEALAIDYDPLYNYDRTEEVTDTESTDTTGTETSTSTQDSTATKSGTTEDSGTSTSTTSGSTTNTPAETSTENTVSAYNSDSYQPANKSSSTVDTAGSTTDTHTTTTSATASSTSTETDTQNTTGSGTQNTTGNTEREYTHTARMYGNIGVTTSQQMLEAELEIARWNMYSHIADIFASEFCVALYI